MLISFIDAPRGACYNPNALIPFKICIRFFKEKPYVAAVLEIRDLHTRVEDQPILRGVDLVIQKGETHALMGPNGSGKSTLANTILGHPNYEITAGEIIFDGVDVRDLSTDERARLGIFLAFQYPTTVSGVTVANLIRTSMNAQRKAEDPDAEGISIPDFRKMLLEKMEMLQMDRSFAGRYLNEGFSGGEKKRTEVLQMAALRPKLAILDEIDSGLDVDALRIVSEGVNTVAEAEDMSVLVITHYERILDYVKPDHVHILMNGRIVKSGGPDLATYIEENGYEAIRAEQAE
jgi:Fe-S cluster assembly ATP-binding protein